MEKLELKHIVPYLPYGLKYCRVHQSPIDLTEKIEFVGEVSTKGDEHNINNNLLCEYLYMKYLPILHPLSDLTEDIEHNGGKFVPIIELAKVFHIAKSATTHFSNVRNLGFYGASVNCHVENDDGRFAYYQIKNGEFVLSNTFEEVQKLLEWHFDVFGLIENGLAIDINTLEL